MNEANEQYVLSVVAPSKIPPMTQEDIALAKILFKEWFSRHPNIHNPTDINKREKFNFMAEIGWKKFMLMQRARKTNIRVYGYPFPWTKADYWQKQKQKTLPVVG